MMDLDHITGIVWAIDKAILALAILLSVMTVIYMAVRNMLDKRNERHLNKIKEYLRSLARPSNGTLKDACSILIKRLSIGQLFDIVRDTMVAKESGYHLKNCLDASGRLAQLENIAKNSRNKWSRIQAIVILGYIDIPSSLSVLKRGLLDKDADVSYFSMISLGQIKNDTSARILLDFLKEKVYSGYKIVSILESFPSTIIKDVIEKTESTDSVVRFWAVKLLSKFKPQDYAGTIEKLTRDESADVRAAACECLGGLGKSEFRHPLLRCLQDSAWFVRMRAVRALSKIFGTQCLPDIINLLKDSSQFVKESVKQVLIRNIDASLPYIEKCLLGHDKEAKRYCIDALVDAGYIPRLLRSVLSEKPRSKQEAIRLLDALIKSGFHFGLRKLLDDFDEDKRKRHLALISAIDSDLADRIMYYHRKQ